MRPTIPNKDFILRYDVAGSKIDDALLTHRRSRRRLLHAHPAAARPRDPDRDRAAEGARLRASTLPARMRGFPIEKAKESMTLALDDLNPHDTFNLITFAGDTHDPVSRARPATPENSQRAQAFLGNLARAAAAPR